MRTLLNDRGPRSVGVCLTILALCASTALSQTGAKPAARAAQVSKKPSIYDKKADTNEQLAQATVKAKRDNTRVLVMFGGDWCGWCHKLHELFATHAEIRRLLSYEYELVMVDTEAPHAQELLKECSKGETRLGYPYLAVLDQGGKVLTGQETGSLEEGDHHDPTKVLAFLKRWVVEPKDAQVLLQESLARASSDDKKVFLSFGAPWCGWCHRLENYMARPEVASILDRDFVVLKVDVDRMTRGKDVMKRFRPDDTGGIPWFAFLDSQGHKLATSDIMNGQNVGYPFEPKEIDAFMSTLEGQVRRIEPGQLARLRSSLEAAAQEIKAEQDRRRAEAAAKREKK
jgi:thiol:disulfide interchange protein